MLPITPLDDKFLRWLVTLDEAICRRVAAGGCRRCGGALHRGDYPRKPRGGLVAAAGEVFTRRFSLCCGRDGCRLRATPPSVRFLGRRVYFGVAVLLGTIAAQAAATAREARQATGIPSRTLRRWSTWWREGFPTSRLFEESRGLFVPALEVAALPASLVERFAAGASDAATALVRTLGFLAPLTTASVADGARFVRVE